MESCLQSLSKELYANGLGIKEDCKCCMKSGKYKHWEYRGERRLVSTNKVDGKQVRPERVVTSKHGIYTSLLWLPK